MSEFVEIIRKMEIKIGGFDYNKIFVIFYNAYQYVVEKGYISDKLKLSADSSKALNYYYYGKSAIDLNPYFDILEFDGICELITYILSEKNSNLRKVENYCNSQISELVFKLLEVNKCDRIVNLNSGLCSFLINMCKLISLNEMDVESITGVEINYNFLTLAKIAFAILGKKYKEVEFINGNSLDPLNEKYNKGFIFPPIGIKQLLGDNSRKSYLFPKICFSNSNSSEWCFIDSLLNDLSNVGSRAIALVTAKTLFNRTDKDYRKALIESGRLEGIIEMPFGSLSYTGIKIFMLIFSENNNSVKLLDASKIANPDNRRHVNFDLLIDGILKEYYSPEIVKKENKELASIENLVPSNILLNVEKLENGVRLEKVAEDIFTGNQYTLRNFEEKGLITDENTGYKILTSSDIEDGIIKWNNLNSINCNDKKLDKFALKQGDVVLSSKSSKIKTVVIDIGLKDKIIVTGGMIVIRPKVEKINSTYLKMFLDSNQGKKALKSIQKGTLIVTITANGLKTIEVPLIDIKKQEEKARKYNIQLATLISYKKEIQRLEESLNNLFDEDEE